MRWTVGLLLCLASTGALAQEGTLQADFRRESERVGDSCGTFSVKAVPGCAIALFTDHPLHVAAGSMPPQNGFSLGAAFVTAKNTENWRLSWDVDAVGSFSGSWRAGGYMKLIHTPREPVRIVKPCSFAARRHAQDSSASRRSTWCIVHGLQSLRTDDFSEQAEFLWVGK